MTPTILIADDDPEIRAVIQYAFRREGWEMLLASDGEEALGLYAEESPDVLVLDINMPKVDGLEVCRNVRSRSETPVLFVSSRDEELDKILGLELGGDDYITKPFSPRELVARVKAILRRIAHKPQGALELHRIDVGLLVLDLDTFEVQWDGNDVTLTVTEFGLLKLFAENNLKVVTREDIQNHVYDGLQVSSRTVDSHIRRLRQKLNRAGAENILETLHAKGFRLRVGA